jgi:uncharacterized protein (DUF302 family)
MNTTIRPLLTAYTITLCAFFWSGTAISADPNPNQRMLSHDVYFMLKDKSDGAKEKLVAGCEKYLANHPGTVWFAAGVLVDEHQRDVNDRDYDVALHIVFKDEVSHDKYQDAPQHHRFIDEYKENWETVRVFDSWLDLSSNGETVASGMLSENRRNPMLYVQEASGSVDEVIKKLEEAAAANQFGVLGVHDLKQKMNAKGVEFGPECRVVEVCNPKKAKSVLEADMSISNALPCRISVYEEGGKVKVSTLKPTAILGLFGQPELEPVAREVEDTMIRIIDAACQ